MERTTAIESQLLRLAIALAFGLLFLAPIPAQAQWRFETWFGNAYNLGTPVTFEQEGQPDITIDGEWSTRPWRPTWYYAARIVKWSDNSAWAFEYMHHKVYLDNPTDEVLRFRITNGVNLLFVQRHWRVSGFEVGVGAGPLLAVPVSTVRGKSYGKAEGVFGSRYGLAGGAVMATAARRIKLLPHLYASFAAKGTAARMSVPIADGRAKLDNFALHLHWGISFQSEP